MQTSIASCPSPEKTTGRSTEISGGSAWDGKIKKLVNNMVSKQRAQKSMAERFRVARCEIMESTGEWVGYSHYIISYWQPGKSLGLQKTFIEIAYKF